LSFQGFTGLINTPNAQVMQEGLVTLHYNNQFDNSLRKYNYNKKYEFEDNYIAGFGLFSFMEIQGRLSEAPGYQRDLSANVKIQSPWHYKYLPDIAIGIQDLGGAANHYDNTYIVIDKSYRFIRASLGYGHSSSNLKRMDGLFGGIEIKATDWLYLMAENDTKENHVALKMQLPKQWQKYFNLQTLISYNTDDKTTNFGISLNIPLKHKSKEITQVGYVNELKAEREIYNSDLAHKKDFAKYKIEQKKSYNHKWKKKLKLNKIHTINDFKAQLNKFGFENIAIAKKDDTIYIKAENRIFDHNDLDAIGYILGKLAFSELPYKKYTLILLKNNLQTIVISGKICCIKHYFENASIKNENKLKKHIYISRYIDLDKDIHFSKKLHSSFFIPRFEFSLGLPSTIGTEYGVFDYIASLRTNLTMNIYDGGVISMMYEIPFANSDDFNKGGVYYNDTLLKNRIVNALYNQTFHYKNLLTTFSIGKIKTDYTGISNQTNITSTSGKNSFSFYGGVFKYKNNDIKDKEFYIGTYRYNYSPKNIYLKTSYGKFWAGDIGGKIELMRFFGETSLSFYYTNTSLNSQKEEMVGITASFPLTTRKLYRANYFQIKGKKDWNYYVSSTVHRNDGTNSLNASYAKLPSSYVNLETEYLNRDRLSKEYILNNLDRLRESYLKYK
jgi:hypothetical protein